jgi:UTP:GlnB (protein PII) uridylyltransferase
VDFFWLEPASSRFGEQLDLVELTSFDQTLRELIAEEQLVQQQPSRRDTIPAPRPEPVRVYFELDALRRDEYKLIVETGDFSGLLFAISSALHAQGARILASDIRTKEGVARDWFLLESIQALPFTAERLCDVQQAVFLAVLNR